jgi:hypothetical protein
MSFAARVLVLSVARERDRQNLAARARLHQVDGGVLLRDAAVMHQHAIHHERVRFRHFEVVGRRDDGGGNRLDACDAHFGGQQARGAEAAKSLVAARPLRRGQSLAQRRRQMGQQRRDIRQVHSVRRVLLRAPCAVDVRLHRVAVDRAGVDTPHCKASCCTSCSRARFADLRLSMLPFAQPSPSR